MLEKEIKKTIGRLIFEERQKKNFCITTCANALNLKPIAYERIELGVYKVSWKKVEQVLKYFNKKIHITFVDDTEKSNGENRPI